MQPFPNMRKAMLFQESSSTLSTIMDCGHHPTWQVSLEFPSSFCKYSRQCAMKHYQYKALLPTFHSNVLLVLGHCAKSFHLFRRRWIQIMSASKSSCSLPTLILPIILSCFFFNVMRLLTAKWKLFLMWSRVSQISL